jgi:hypothetical protein
MCHLFWSNLVCVLTHEQRNPKVWNMASFRCGPTSVWRALKNSIPSKHGMFWGWPNVCFNAWVMQALKHSVLIPCPHGPCAPSEPHPSQFTPFPTFACTMYLSLDYSERTINENNGIYFKIYVKIDFKRDGFCVKCYNKHVHSMFWLGFSSFVLFFSFVSDVNFIFSSNANVRWYTHCACLVHVKWYLIF